MKKRVLGLILVFLLIVANLAACAKKSDEKSQETDSKDSKTEETSDTSVTAEPEETSSLSGEIVYWSMWQETEPQANILKSAIESFEKANPNCKVTVEWTGRTIRDVILPALESGEHIDIFDTDPNNIYNADASKLLDLTELYNSKSLQGTDTVKSSLLGGLVSLDETMSQKAGLTGFHSLPYSPYVVSFFYNKAQFAQAGIDAVPKTWDEFDAVCAKLVAAGLKPFTVDDAYRDLIYSFYMQRAIGSEACAALAQGTVDSKSKWDDPMVKQMLTTMEDYAKKGYFSDNIDTNIYPAGQTEFALGNATMTINGSWFPSEIANMVDENFQWGEFAIPTVTGSSVPITENNIGGQSFMVNAKTQNKEAVFELLRYFISNETQQKFTDNGLVPCTNSTDWPASVSDQKVIVESLTSNVDWGAGMETDFGMSVVLSELTKVMAGDQTADEALTAIKGLIK
ncbi:MAG: transporter substrate-binding protein [Firmicutes bacterium]|nr:transporter substrate-binding protein [Bacillota bacterium]